MNVLISRVSSVVTKIETTKIPHELKSRLGPSVPDSQRADVPWWPSRLEYILKTCPNSSRPKNILLHNPDWSNSFWQTRYFPILSLINADGFEYKEEEGWPGVSDEKYKIGIDENMANKVWNWGQQGLSKIPNCLDVCRALNIFRVLFKVGHFELVACHVAVPCYPRAKQIQSLPCNPFVWPYIADDFIISCNVFHFLSMLGFWSFISP